MFEITENIMKHPVY